MSAEEFNFLLICEPIRYHNYFKVKSIHTLVNVTPRGEHITTLSHIGEHITHSPKREIKIVGMNLKTNGEIQIRSVIDISLATLNFILNSKIVLLVCRLLQLSILNNLERIVFGDG